jgi:hypothetical protein
MRGSLKGGGYARERVGTRMCTCSCNGTNLFALADPNRLSAAP